MELKNQLSPDMQPLPRDAWLNRIRYRSWHRGCKETDLIVGGFCMAHIESFSDDELRIFETFLEEDDAEIWGWITGKIALSQLQYQFIIDRLRAFEVYNHPQ